MMTTVPIVLTILLIVLLIKREFLHGMQGPRSRAILRGLNIAIVPLLVVFLVMVGIQLRSGKSNDIAETARANMAETSVSSTTQAIASSATTDTQASTSVASVATAQPTAPSAPTAASVASAAPTAAPTAASVAAAPTLAPTAALAPEVVSQQVIASEAALQSGQIDAVINFPGGTRSSAALRFDLSDANGGPRLYMTTLYTGTNSTQRYEQLVIGNNTWQRTGNAAWKAQATQFSVREQVQSYLPQANLIQNSNVAQNGQSIELRWSNAGPATTNTLSIDSNSGIPQALQRMMGNNQAELTITYSNWNKPVVIQAPTTKKR